MRQRIAQTIALAGLAVATAGMALAEDGPKARRSAIERYGLAGYTQPIGLHHGFHIERIAADSPASRDRLGLHDVITKVDGEEIRSLEHFRTLLTDAIEDDGLVDLTVLKGISLEHHIVKGHLRPREGKTARKSRRDDADAPR